MSVNEIQKAQIYINIRWNFKREVPHLGWSGWDGRLDAIVVEAISSYLLFLDRVLRER
jgi:hypothetical protein